jgi:phage baseplate assembly protein W
MATLNTIQQPDPVHYSDFSGSFVVHPVSGDVARVTEYEAVRRSVRNLIMTNRYERVGNPEIGSNIRRALFEPMDGATTSMIKSYIRETLENHEPRCRIQDVQVIPDYDRNAYFINIIFLMFFSENLQTISFSLVRNR